MKWKGAKKQEKKEAAVTLKETVKLLNLNILALAINQSWLF